MPAAPRPRRRSTRPLLLAACAPFFFPTPPARATVTTVQSGNGNSPFTFNAASPSSITGFIVGYANNGLVYNTSGNHSLFDGIVLGFGSSPSTVVGTWDMSNAASLTADNGISLGPLGQTGLFTTSSTGTITAGLLYYGDFNYDLQVDAADYLLIDKSFTQQGGTLSPAFLAQRESQFGDAYVTTLLASIPEPTSLLACGFAIPILSFRRRRS